MKPITIKNEYGETIEVKRDADGNIEVRHSDVDEENFGQLHELSKRSRQPEVAKHLKQKGIDANDPVVKELLARAGSSLVIQGESYFISAQETALILATVKQHGGIVPNWSNQP